MKYFGIIAVYLRVSRTHCQDSLMLNYSYRPVKCHIYTVFPLNSEILEAKLLISKRPISHQNALKLCKRHSEIVCYQVKLVGKWKFLCVICCFSDSDGVWKWILYY